MMFGALPSKWSDWASISSAERWNVGSVWVDSRPWRPPLASNTGISNGAARADISSTICQASSVSPARAPASRLGLPDIGHDRRVGGRTDRPERDRVLELVDRARVVPDVGGGRRD